MPIKLPRWFVALAFIVALPTLAFADPMFQAEADGAKVVLTDEPCKLQAVANLKYRATWSEKGKTYEGCFGPRPDMGVVMAYFEDRTVVALPIQMFVKVSTI